MSATHKNAVSTAQKRFDQENRINPAGAHHPDRDNGSGILKPVNTGKIGSGVGTPFAQKTNDLG